MILSLPIFQVEFTLSFKNGSIKPDYFLHLRQKHHDALLQVSQCHGSAKCSDRYSCPYHSSFDQMVSSDPAMAKKHQKPPLPFAWQFNPSILSDTDSSVTGRFTVAGRASFHPEAHIESLLIMFKSLSADNICLDKLDAVSFAGERIDCLDFRNHTKEMSLLTVNDLTSQISSPSKASINFYSPLKLLEEGKTVKEFNLRIIAGSLLRRFSAIFDTYSESILYCDYALLISSLNRIECRQELVYRSLNNGFSGLTGDIELRGDLDILIRWLQFGEYFNVGKGAAFGMGAYRLEVS